MDVLHFKSPAAFYTLASPFSGRTMWPHQGALPRTRLYANQYKPAALLGLAVFLYEYLYVPARPSRRWHSVNIFVLEKRML